MFGLGKSRSKLGKWMDARGMKQEWIIEKAGISKGTATKICNEEEYVPTGTTMQKLIKALREVDSSVQASQFWDL